MKSVSANKYIGLSSNQNPMSACMILAPFKEYCFGMRRKVLTTASSYILGWVIVEQEDLDVTSDF
jgi:hypothetical protein